MHHIVGLDMTENNQSGKSEEKRLEEAKKWQAETTRSLSVLKAKEAHKLIEEMEKSRKRSAILSVMQRLLENGQVINMETKGLLDFFVGEKGWTQREILPHHRISVENSMKSYESTRYDFQKTMELNDDDMERLFHKLDVDSNNVVIVIQELHSIVDQMLDMHVYCQRKL